MAYSLFMALAIVTLFTNINLGEADWKTDIRTFIDTITSSNCKSNLKDDIKKYTKVNDACIDLFKKSKDIAKKANCKESVTYYMYLIACNGTHWKANTIKYVVGLEDSKCRSELYNNAITIESKHHKDACKWAKKNMGKSYRAKADMTDTITACPPNVNMHFKNMICDESEWIPDMDLYINTMLSPGKCQTNLKKEIAKYKKDSTCKDFRKNSKDIQKSTGCTKVQTDFMSGISCKDHHWGANTMRYVLGLEAGKCRKELFANANTLLPKKPKDACNWAKGNNDAKDCPNNVNVHFKEAVCGASMMVLGTLTALACFVMHLLNKF